MILEDVWPSDERHGFIARFIRERESGSWHIEFFISVERLRVLGFDGTLTAISVIEALLQKKLQFVDGEKRIHITIPQSLIEKLKKNESPQVKVTTKLKRLRRKIRV